MATLFPPRNSEDSIDGPSELTGVSSTILFWEQQRHKKQPQGNPDQQQRDGKHKEQPVGQDLQHGVEGNKEGEEEEGTEGKKMEKEDQQQREGEQKEQPHGQDLQHGEEEGKDDGQEEEIKKLEKEKEKEKEQEQEQEKEEEVEVEEKEKDRTERAKQKVLRFLSMLVLVAMVPVVWCSISEPPVLVWRFSFLLCCSSIIWSRRLDVAVSADIMVLVTFCGFMTALYLDAVLDHEIGVLLAHLNSHSAAGMLGYALARHCQRNGLEVTPATATPPKKLSEKQQNNAFHTLIHGWCHMGMITAVCTARMAWVVWYRAEYPTEYLILQAFGPMSFALLLWSMFLGGVLLRGVFIGEDRLALLGGLLVLVELLFLVSWMVLGDVGAMVVTWLGILVWTGWFGYSLCVYNSFKDEPLLQPVHWFPPVLVPPINAPKSSST